MFDLYGKTALITGATGGLGFGIVEAFVKCGANVVISGTRTEALEKISKTFDPYLKFITCNFKDAQDVESLIGQAQEILGHIDILVNNAGITRDGLLMRMKDSDYQDVLTVNLEAPFRLMRAVSRSMIKRRYGRIINITSIVGVTGNPGQANYAASKAGIIGLSKSIAAELATRQVTVNCIAPGFMTSPMTEALSQDQQASLLKQIPMGRMGTPEDLGTACVFLASASAGYITGQTLHINGGMAMI